MINSELYKQILEIINYCEENKNYLDDIDEKYKDFKKRYKGLFELIKDKQMDIDFFLKMLTIKEMINNGKISKDEGDMQFGSLLAKKYNIPTPKLNDDQIRELSNKYNLPFDKLKDYYSNLKN